MISNFSGENNLEQLLKRTPEGKAILLKLAGAEADYPEFLGKGFFKTKVGKVFKKVGKVTGKITGNIAKIAAAAVGIPPSAIDSLARIDPTAHKKLVQQLAQSPAAAIEAVQPKKGILHNPVYLAAGAAGIIAIIFIATKKK